MSAIHQVFLSTRGGLSSFRYYRMFITANNGDASFTNVGELQMRGSIGGGTLIPTQSANTAQTLFSSQNNNSTNGAWRAFDGVTASGSPWITASGQALNSYVGWDFLSPVTVKEMAYTAGLGGGVALNRSPRDWVFQGSNDNSLVLWETLVTVTGAVGNSVGTLLVHATGL